MARPHQGKGVRGKVGAGAPLGFEGQLWQAADALRGSMDAAEYKHVVLGLIFLKYVSDAWRSASSAERAKIGIRVADRGHAEFPARSVGSESRAAAKHARGVDA